MKDEAMKTLSSRQIVDILGTPRKGVHFAGCGGECNTIELPKVIAKSRAVGKLVKSWSLK